MREEGCFLQFELSRDEWPAAADIGVGMDLMRFPTQG